MQTLLQYIVIGLGAGATYALFAQGAVLIYRGSGLVNFGHGAIGMVGAYIAFLELHKVHKWATAPAMIVGVIVSTVVSVLFQATVLRVLKRSAAITRVIATIGLLALVQAAVERKYGGANEPVDQFLPHKVYDWGGVKVQEERIWLLAIAIIVTYGLWAWTKYTRVGLAIAASSENERAVRTLGWSPDRLGALTWGLGGALAGGAGVLVAPLTGLSTETFTVVVTVAAFGAALLGGFTSFPMTLVGGLVVGIGEALATGYKADVERWLHQDRITGLNRATSFVVILIVLVIRGRGLPLRSHVAERLPKLGTGVINVRGLIVGAGIFLAMLTFWFDKNWQRSAFVSLSVGVMILSIVVLTGFAGQISLAQWAIGGIGAMIAGKFVHMHNALLPPIVCILLGVVMVIPIGVLFALPALRTRGVNLAVVTLGLGFTAYEVVLANPHYAGPIVESGTRIGRIKLFGIQVDALTHTYRWAVVNLIALVLTGLMVANLRRSGTGRKLIAVRTNERAAASLGISVFGVKIYAFAVAAAIASLAGILVGFQFQTITYTGYNVFQSIFTLGFAVIGGLGYVLSAAFAAPNAIGGLGTKIIEVIHLGKWDKVVGGAMVLLILMGQQDGVAAKATHDTRPLFKKLRLAGKDPVAPVLTEQPIEPVPPKSLNIEGLTVRFGGTAAVNNVSFQVNPGEVVGLIGPNGAGKTTIIDAVTGFVKPSAGNLTLDGVVINEWNAARRARAGMRRSFQSLELFEDLSVEANLRAGADQAPRKSWFFDLFWPRKETLPSASVAAIRDFNLSDDLLKVPGELPYGRRRLVGIARSVASGPSIVMLDEPAAGLDENESRELASLIRKLAVDWKIGVLLVEHDVNLVMNTCDRIVVIEFGVVIASGTPKEVRENPAVKAAYLGTYEADSSEVTA